jgi:hypothetical protein
VAKRQQPYAYYTRVRHSSQPGAWFKQCACGHINAWTRKVCGGATHLSGRLAGCGRRLRRRPRPKKDRSIGARMEAESKLLDQWLTKLSLAATKIRYYRGRLRSLERELAKGGRPRPKRQPRPARAIRVRDRHPGDDGPGHGVDVETGQRFEMEA